MKKLVLLVVFAAMTALSTGCATPAYSARERGQYISRNIAYDWKQIQDDVDSIFLLRHPSRLTIWHVR